MNYEAYKKALEARDLTAYRALGVLISLHRSGDVPAWAAPIVANVVAESEKNDEAVLTAAEEKAA